MPIQQEILDLIESNNPKLTKLTLDRQKIFDEDVIKIAEALKKNNTLLILKFFGNPITARSLKTFVQIMNRNQQIMIYLDINTPKQLGDAVFKMTSKREQAFIAYHRNHERSTFIQKLLFLSLAQRSNNSSNTTSWHDIPKDIRRHIFKLIKFPIYDNHSRLDMITMGKDRSEIHALIDFVFDNTPLLIETLKKARENHTPFKVIQTRPYTNGNGPNGTFHSFPMIKQIDSTKRLAQEEQVPDEPEKKQKILSN